MRGKWYNSLRLDPHRPNLVAENKVDEHNILRHQMAAGVGIFRFKLFISCLINFQYSGRDVPQMEAILDERFLEWTDYIERYWTSSDQTTRAYDIARGIQYLTTDTISHLCFGRPIGFVAKHEDVHGFLGTLENRLPIAELFSVITELFTFLATITKLPMIKRILIPQNKDQSGVGKILGVCYPILVDANRNNHRSFWTFGQISRRAIEKRLDQGLDQCNSDILTSFLRRGMDTSQAETEITVSLFAGMDTTATGMRATLLYILSSPAIYLRLCREIRSRFPLSPALNPIIADEAQDLPYLQACIKEGLRLFPPVTALRERLVPPHGDNICGFRIPPNVNVGLNTKGLLRKATVFGKDSDVFRPERWLQRDPARLMRMERVHELVFGAGATRCLGMKIATLSLNKFFVEVRLMLIRLLSGLAPSGRRSTYRRLITGLLPQLLRRYDLAVINPEKPWRSRCHGIFFQDDFYVRVTKQAIDG